MPVLPPFLFDLDGTLADTLPDIAASTNHVRRTHSLPALDLTAVRALIGHGAMTLLQRALPELALPADDARWAEVRACYWDHHETQCVRSARLYPGVRRHLEQLAAAGHALAVVTNKPERFARLVVAHLGLAPLLRAVIGGDTLPQRKPDPAPVHHALAACHAPRGHGTMVGDGETDLRAGKAAGLRTIACLYGYRPAADLLREGADEYWSAFGVPAAGAP